MGDRFIRNLASTCRSYSAAFCSSFQYFSPATATHFLPEIGFLIDLPQKGQSFLDQPFSQKGCDTPLSTSHAGDKGDYYSFFTEKDAPGLVGAVDSTLNALSRCRKAAVEPLVLSAKEVSRSGQSAMHAIRCTYLKFSAHGQRPVDMVCVTAALCKEEGKAAVPVPSNQPFSLKRLIKKLSKTSAQKRGVMSIIGGLIGSKKGKLYFKLIAAVAVFAAFASAIFTLAPSAVPRAVSTANASTINITSAFAFAADHLLGYSNFSSENGSQEENSTFKWLRRTLYQPQNLDELDRNANVRELS